MFSLKGVPKKSLNSDTLCLVKLTDDQCDQGCKSDQVDHVNQGDQVDQGERGDQGDQGEQSDKVDQVDGGDEDDLQFQLSHAIMLTQAHHFLFHKF